jgi:glycosyltransferase involved in cell wall biosynthesis
MANEVQVASCCESSPDRMNISVVVPVFNGESSLRELASRLRPVLRALCENYELILVNDGSEDGSWETITRLTAKHRWINGVDLMRNYGQHNALLCGIRAAKYEVAVTLDDDLQHPPEEIPKLVDKLAEGYDVVYGVPEKRQHDLWRNVAALVTGGRCDPLSALKFRTISAPFAPCVREQETHSSDITVHLSLLMFF